MSDFVGQPCVRCGQSLASPLVGGPCPRCGNAVHHGCLGPDDEGGTPLYCARCGGTPPPGVPSDDALTTAPVLDDRPEQPFGGPDIRLRRPWKKKVVVALVLLLAVGMLIGLGYAGFRWSQRRDVERVVRKGFEQHTSQSVSAIHLRRQDDGTYTGTVTTAAGEEWDVTARLIGTGRQEKVRWRARPPLERAERELRRDMEQKLNKPVRSIRLARQPDGRLGGTAELQSGEVYDVHEPDDDSPYLLVYEWNQATVEKWVRESARQRHNDVLDKVSLTRRGPSSYTGTASGASGLDYLITIVPDAPRRGGNGQARLTLHVVPESLPRWVSRGLEKQLEARVTKITLVPHPGGYFQGQAVLDSGLAYEVRAGTPPAWRNGPRADVPTWAAVLAPRSYTAWVKKGLEEVYRQKVRSLELKPRPGGNEVGIARLADRTTFWVVLEKAKRQRKEGEANLWPDLPDVALKWHIATRPPRD
jgi:hypothetical protein